MARHSWKQIRSIADPQTIEGAARKTQAMLDALIRQDSSESDPADRAVGEWEDFPGENNEPSP
jgi:hypothetical protein